jgi:hypothetical protein
MKSSYLISCSLLFVYAFANAGCQPAPSSQVPTTQNELDSAEITPCIRYAPVSIDITPLTEFVPADNTQRPRINLYVSLLDSFGSQVKSPGRFRFELYERAQRSAEPKGKRLVIWPELDLTDPATNNEYWRDFLRSYEFTLPLEQFTQESHILEVTFFCPSGSRISSEFTLR